MRKIRRRITFIAVVIVIANGLFIARLAQVQLIQTESFTKSKVNLIENSIAQRTQQVLIDDGRGKFLDRHGQPIGEKYVPTIVLFPFLKNYQWPIEKFQQIIPLSEWKIQKLLTEAKDPVLLTEDDGILIHNKTIEKVNDLNIPGVFGVYMERKISDDVAAHFIGLTSVDKRLVEEKYVVKENIPYLAKFGVTGLQKAFDEFLLAEEETKLLYHVDGLGRPLFGVNVKYIADSNPFYPISVNTTIDLTYQQMAEDIFNKYEVQKGGLILLDIETNEVLALVSKPDLNRNDQSTQYNYMYETMVPGSVFKTVIAAAALEENIVSENDMYNCDLNLYSEREKNPKKRLGTLTFEESFAQSCNYTFATLGKQLMEKDQNILEEYAKKLGLLHLVGWSGPVYHYDEFKQIPEEKAGSVWGKEKDKKVSKAIQQTSIGQLNVQVSPLAIVNMMATIARGGEKKAVKVASDLSYKNGTTMYHFDDQTLQSSAVSSYTAQQLQHLLREVVKSEKGTGRRFQTLPVDVAGKSGTAEIKNEGKIVHKWFAGYFPFQQPKYALVVVEMDTTSEKAQTNAIFYDMVQSMYVNTR
ncbi:penicillin-binding transpeptidase domain-containing protein [Bacillus sp. FJAT-47783]|uniref:peptidoglycan D,D-transpeptidase FtsI family protein n=1 Tax=Bacillus sp. FJAT-47783 TaxID=2922712 RepID=UPI001FAE1407|nr:penicillin-binding transpeptidase domain-containing protein [Bacillus sp. FJAT-47783]